MKVKDPDIILHFNIGNWKYLKRTYKILYIYIIHLEDRFAQKEVTAAKAAHGLLISSAAPCPSAALLFRWRLLKLVPIMARQHIYIRHHKT